MDARIVVMQSQSGIGKPGKSVKQTFVPPLLRHGWIGELAELADCDRNTVRRALYNNSGGTKSQKVRELYRAKYINRMLC